jgi:hypothetical protein
METKKCNKCQEDKELDEFYWRNKTLGQKHNICKVCSESNRKSKEHYQKYKNEYIVRVKKRKAELVAKNRVCMLEYLKTHHCVDCGESNPIMMEFNHLKPEEKVYNISQMMSDFSWDKILSEIEKCEVVCANHHKVRTAIQQGWYKNNIGD